VLFARSFQAARTQPLGFQTDGRLIVQVVLDNHGYDEDSGVRFIQEALDRIGSLPGVRSATTTRQVPFQGDWTTEFDPPPGARPNRGDVVHAGADAVATGYFETMGIPILRGRPLDGTDVAGAPLAVVINQKLAEDLWPGEDPLGRTLPRGEEQRFTVVGVVADAQYYELGEDPYPHLWVSVLQTYRPRVNFLVRADEERGGTLRAVQDAIHEVDPDVAFGWVGSLEQVMDDQLARYEVSAVLVGVFAALALILAAAGLYGVVSFLVARGTREIGVRMALGARPHRVAARVVGFALRLATLGVGVGLVGAWVLSGLTRSLLFGVGPGDPFAFGIASAVLVGTTVLAALVPARRATKVDPMQTIRME
jgi:putative ABC transport system permease protein